MLDLGCRAGVRFGFPGCGCSDWVPIFLQKTDNPNVDAVRILLEYGRIVVAQIGFPILDVDHLRGEQVCRGELWVACFRGARDNARFKAAKQ